MSNRITPVESIIRSKILIKVMIIVIVTSRAANKAKQHILPLDREQKDILFAQVVANLAVMKTLI